MLKKRVYFFRGFLKNSFFKLNINIPLLYIILFMAGVLLMNVQQLITIFLITSTVLQGMEQREVIAQDEDKIEDLWTIERYFNTPELKRWGTTSKEQAQEYINTGQQIVDTLIKNGHQNLAQNYPYARSEELKKLVAVSWFFFSKALEQKKPFYNGMFVIKDTEKMDLYTFFYEYVKNTIDKSHEKPGYCSTNRFSYARLSTHFKYDKQDCSEYGIDIRLNEKEWSSCDLPGGCAHILFGKLKDTDYSKSRFYLKMEDAGLCWFELPFHITGVIGSASRKTLPKIIGEWAASAVVTLNDGTYLQKEHLPLDIKKKYYEACRRKKITPVNVYSIAGIWDHVRTCSELISIKDLLEKEYSDIQERFGNELIIHFSESIN
jgi:hypothetical protein